MPLGLHLHDWAPSWALAGLLHSLSLCNLISKPTHVNQAPSTEQACTLGPWVGDTAMGSWQMLVPGHRGLIEDTQASGKCHQLHYKDETETQLNTAAKGGPQGQPSAVEPGPL